MTMTTGRQAGLGPADGTPESPTSPLGARLPRRQWRDPRLIVGVLLVVCSGLATAWVVQASDHRVAVWAVSADMPTGSPIEVGDLRAVSVQVPDLSAYWLADVEISEGLVASRDIAAGELLTRSGTRVSDVDVRIVTLPVLRNQMPSDLSVGRRVDVYVVERAISGEPEGQPELVLRNAIVAGVDGDSGAFGGTSLEIGVALSLPDEQVAKVLDAQARGTLTLVDVPVTTS